MRLKSFLYKLFNTVCSVDITKVMVLPFHTFIYPENHPTASCKYASTVELNEIAAHNKFGLSKLFVSRITGSGYSSIIATVNCEVVGICFLAGGHVPATYNKGGENFKGIAVIVPEDCRYLFKLEVLDAYRGQRIQGALLRHAVESLKHEGVKSLVTTTEWNNYSFQKGALRSGFIVSGHATELVVAGSQFNLLPKPMDALSSEAKRRSLKPFASAIQFHSSTSAD